MTKQPNPRQFRNVCHDVLRAAMSERYPVLVDRNAHPAVVLGCGAALVIAAGERLDSITFPELLNEATEAAYYVGDPDNPDVPNNAKNDMSDHERATAKAVLALLWECYDKPAVVLYDRAFAYVAQRDVANTLSLIGVVVGLLTYIENLKPGVLAALDGELEMQAWVDAATAHLDTATDLEDLS